MTMLLTVLVVSLLAYVDGHGRLINPPGRSTMWRYGFSTPHNSDDHQLSCGGFGVQYYRNDGKCGICGDPYGGPRDNEAGGKYATGTIAKTYKQGDTIIVQVEITVNHGGWFEFRLCPNNNYKKKATQECLDSNLLEQVNGETRYVMPTGLGILTIHLKLPEKLTCSQCVLQWKWNTASNMRCDGAKCCRGCGPQEQFYGCSDVSITPTSRPVLTSGTHYKPPSNNQIHNTANNANIGSHIAIPGSFISVAGIGSLLPAQKENGGDRPSSECRATLPFRMFNSRADTWCAENCKTYCPSTRCVDACRSQYVVMSGCTAKNFWRQQTPGADAWCRQRCQLGLCPLQYCNQTCLRRL